MKNSTSAKTILNDGRLLLVALWLGAAIFFSFVVAPSAFKVLPARELAGALVSRTLAVVNVSGFVIALLALLTLPAVGHAVSKAARWAQAATLFLIAAANGIAHWLIGAALLAMRAQMRGGIDSLAPTDPARVAFNDLHRYSVMALTVAMVSALVAIFLMARRRE